MPTSRRDILKLSALGISSALLTNALSQTNPTTFTIALISDTHLGREGEGPSAQFQTAITEINASPAEFTLCCGDLVNAGENLANEKRYPEWVALASKLKNPWHAIPGNHDPSAMFLKHIAKQTDFTIDRAPFRFICFRDAQNNPSHQGEVTPEQILWLEKQLDDAKHDNRRAILVAHVVYHDNQKPDHGWAIKFGRNEFTQLLTAHAKTIAAFFSGHHHMGLRGWSDTLGIHEMMIPSNCWNFATDLSPAPGFSNAERRPGWVQAELSPQLITLKYRPLGQPASINKELMLA